MPVPEAKEKEPKMNLLEQLGEPLPGDAVQRTKKEKTHKSYDTDGYGYQYCVDRLNDILGEKWGFSWEILKEIEGKYSTGKPFYDITVKVSIWINDKDNIRSAVGGHIAVLYADALKGAITNAFKKTAAFWGVGRQAYLGLLDDDNKPLPEEENNGNGNKDKKETGSTITPPQNKKSKDNHQETLRKISAACMWLGGGNTDNAKSYFKTHSKYQRKDGSMREPQELKDLSEKEAQILWGKLKDYFKSHDLDMEVALKEYGKGGE